MKVDVSVDVSLGEEEIYEISFSSIIDAVCEVMVIPTELLMSKSRPSYLCEARFIAYYLGWLMTKRSLPSLGRCMDRDHTTVMYGRDKCISLMRSRKGFRDIVEKVKEVAYRNESRRRQAAQLRLEEIKKEFEEATRKASRRVASKGIISGDKVVFPSVNTHG